MHADYAADSGGTIFPPVPIRLDAPFDKPATVKLGGTILPPVPICAGGTIFPPVPIRADALLINLQP